MITNNELHNRGHITVILKEGLSPIKGLAESGAAPRDDLTSSSVFPKNGSKNGELLAVTKCFPGFFWPSLGAGGGPGGSFNGLMPSNGRSSISAEKKGVS